MNRTLIILTLICLPIKVFAQTANVNPTAGMVWAYFGPTLGAGWSDGNSLGFLNKNGDNATRPAVINNIIGGAAIGLTNGVIAAPEPLAPQGVSGSVFKTGIGALDSYTPSDVNCQISFEDCSHILAVGYNAAGQLTTTDHVTAIGNWACYGLVGQLDFHNTCVGIDSLRYANGGNTWYNTIIGEHSGTLDNLGGGVTPNIKQTTAVGYDSARFAPGVANTALGNGALASTTISGGANSSQANPLTGQGNIAIGHNAFSHIQGASNNNVAIGYKAAEQAYTVNSGQTFVGAQSGTSLTTGINNTFFGFNTGFSATTMSGSTLVGYRAGQDVNGPNNVAVGNQALNSVTGTPLTGANNVAVGTLALNGIITTAHDNVGVGQAAGQNITTGTQNVLLGSFAGQSVASGVGNTLLGYNNGTLVTGNNNVVVGRAAGALLTSGGSNVIIGNSAGATNVTTGGNNIVIGATADIPTAAGTNQLNIGDEIVGTLGGGTQIRHHKVTAKTANYPVTLDDSGIHFTNAGAVGEVDFTLPSGYPVGVHYCFSNPVATAPQTIKVIADGSSKILLNGAATTGLTRKDVLIAMEILEAFIESAGLQHAGATLPAL